MKSDFFAIMSGKGGVGKSTISVMFAKILAEENKKILLIDLDICGPSIHTLINNKEGILYNNGAFKPIYIDVNFSFISFGCMLKKDDVVIWRGAKKKAVIEKMLRGLVEGNEYDYIIFDTPPGLTEEHFSILEYRPKLILVTTSQNLALNDIQNTLSYANENKIEIFGVIQNYTCIECPHCYKYVYPYGKDGGELLSSLYEVPLLCKLNIDQDLYRFIENGTFYDKITFTNAYEKLQTAIISKLRL